MNSLLISFSLIYVQGSHASWKVVEFKIGIFQAWNVMEMDICHGKSWKNSWILKQSHRKIVSVSNNFCHSFIDSILYKINYNNNNSFVLFETV